MFSRSKHKLYEKFISCHVNTFQKRASRDPNVAHLYFIFCMLLLLLFLDASKFELQTREPLLLCRLAPVSNFHCRLYHCGYDRNIIHNINRDLVMTKNNTQTKKAYTQYTSSFNDWIYYFILYASTEYIRILYRW